MSESQTSGVFASPAPEDEVSRLARRLRDHLEPLASNVYFAPEVHAAFQEIGFGPGTEEDGCLVLPDLAAYYCSRAGCMGQVPGEVVVAAFGVFNPALIIPEVERGWRTASRDAILAARSKGTTASLERIIGADPGIARATELLRRAAAAGPASGRFLFAGLSSLPWPGTPHGDLWRGADLVREYRGDSHIAAWIAAGLDPVEAGLMTEVYYGMPTKRYHAGRGWPEEVLDDGIARLRSRGLLQPDEVVFTAEGKALRESIEVATDRQMAPILAALGDDYEELIELLAPWAAAIVGAGGFPSAVTQIPASWGRWDAR
jgi:hypothetical protein